jgi:hypothetical protein
MRGKCASKQSMNSLSTADNRIRRLALAENVTASLVIRFPTVAWIHTYKRLDPYDPNFGRDSEGSVEKRRHSEVFRGRQWMGALLAGNEGAK